MHKSIREIAKHVNRIFNDPDASAAEKDFAWDVEQALKNSDSYQSMVVAQRPEVIKRLQETDQVVRIV